MRTNDLGGRVILGITHYDNSPSTGFDLIALGDILGRVIGALGLEIGMDFANDGAHVPLREDYDGVHIRQRRQNLRAFSSGHYGTALAFQGAHGRIVIHRDNQFAAEFPSGVKVAYVSDVQYVETSVGQRNALAGAPPIRDQALKFVARNNLGME